MKYKLTRETKEVDGIKLYRIQALRDFNGVKKGDKGGWIEKEENLSQEGDCWVFDNAEVSDNARVYGDAWVYGNARVYQLELIGGYFYHTKDKSETIEKVEQDNDETLCSDPGFGEEEPKGKKVKIRIADGQIVEGEIIEDQQTN